MYLDFFSKPQQEECPLPLALASRPAAPIQAVMLHPTLHTCQVGLGCWASGCLPEGLRVVMVENTHVPVLTRELVGETDSNVIVRNIRDS